MVGASQSAVFHFQTTTFTLFTITAKDTLPTGLIKISSLAMQTSLGSLSGTMKESTQNWWLMVPRDDHEVADNTYRDGSSELNNTEASFIEDGGKSPHNPRSFTYSTSVARSCRLQPSQAIPTLIS